MNISAESPYRARWKSLKTKQMLKLFTRWIDPIHCDQRLLYIHEDEADKSHLSWSALREETGKQKCYKNYFKHGTEKMRTSTIFLAVLAAIGCITFTNAAESVVRESDGWQLIEDSGHFDIPSEVLFTYLWTFDILLKRFLPIGTKNSLKMRGTPRSVHPSTCTACEKPRHQQISGVHWQYPVTLVILEMQQTVNFQHIKHIKQSNTNYNVDIDTFLNNIKVKRYCFVDAWKASALNTQTNCFTW